MNFIICVVLIWISLVQIDGEKSAEKVILSLKSLITEMLEDDDIAKYRAISKIALDISNDYFKNDTDSKENNTTVREGNDTRRFDAGCQETVEYLKSKMEVVEVILKNINESPECQHASLNKQFENVANVMGKLVEKTSSGPSTIKSTDDDNNNSSLGLSHQDTDAEFLTSVLRSNNVPSSTDFKKVLAILKNPVFLNVLHSMPELCKDYNDDNLVKSVNARPVTQTPLDLPTKGINQYFPLLPNSMKSPETDFPFVMRPELQTAQESIFKRPNPLDYDYPNGFDRNVNPMISLIPNQNQIISKFPPVYEPLSSHSNRPYYFPKNYATENEPDFLQNDRLVPFNIYPEKDKVILPLQLPKSPLAALSLTDDEIMKLLNTPDSLLPPHIKEDLKHLLMTPNKKKLSDNLPLDTAQIIPAFLEPPKKKLFKNPSPDFFSPKGPVYQVPKKLPHPRPYPINKQPLNPKGKNIFQPLPVLSSYPDQGTYGNLNYPNKNVFDPEHVMDKYSKYPSTLYDHNYDDNLSETVFSNEDINPLYGDRDYQLPTGHGKSKFKKIPPKSVPLKPDLYKLFQPVIKPEEYQNMNLKPISSEVLSIQKPNTIYHTKVHKYVPLNPLTNYEDVPTYQPYVFPVRQHAAPHEERYYPMDKRFANKYFVDNDGNLLPLSLKPPLYAINGDFNGKFYTPDQESLLSPHTKDPVSIGLGSSNENLYPLWLNKLNPTRPSFSPSMNSYNPNRPYTHTINDANMIPPTTQPSFPAVNNLYEKSPEYSLRPTYLDKFNKPIYPELPMMYYVENNENPKEVHNNQNGYLNPYQNNFPNRLPNKLQPAEDGTNWIKLAAAEPTQTEVEVIFLLKAKKPIIYWPVFYLTYKVPAVALLKEFERIRRANPSLDNTKQVLQNVVKSYPYSSISPEIESLKQNELSKLLNENAMLIATNVYKNGQKLNPHDFLIETKNEVPLIQTRNPENLSRNDKNFLNTLRTQPTKNNSEPSGTSLHERPRRLFAPMKYRVHKSNLTPKLKTNIFSQQLRDIRKLEVLKRFQNFMRHQLNTTSTRPRSYDARKSSAIDLINSNDVNGTDNLIIDLQEKTNENVNSSELIKQEDPINNESIEGDQKLNEIVVTTDESINTNDVLENKTINITTNNEQILITTTSGYNDKDLNSLVL